MHERAETHQEIEKAIQIRHRENEDRARHMGLIVKDSQLVNDIPRKVSLSSTHEGTAEVKKIFTHAVAEIRKEFEKQNQDLQKKIDRCKQAETDLGKKEKTAIQDAANIEGVVKQINEVKKTKHLALKAEASVIRDARYLEKEKIIQKRLRQHTETKRQEQRKHLKTKLKW